MEIQHFKIQVWKIETGLGNSDLFVNKVMFGKCSEFVVWDFLKYNQAKSFKSHGI